jgi:4-amino-4-deoxy-L-arabinose transferase-like glycosyltransferase
LVRLSDRSTNLNRLAPLVVFVAALLPRLLSLGAFVTWDEPMWVYRSIHFLSALLRGDFAGTLLVGHPGVITMLSGAIGVAVRRSLLGLGAADVNWLEALPALQPTDVEAIRRLAPFLPAAKVPLIVLHAACVTLMYLLLKRLLGFRTAAVATFLIVLDPFHIALSRVLHIDGAASDFMMLSLLALLVGAREWERKHFILSGTLAGLASLSKSYALFMIPFAALVLGASIVLWRRPLRRAAGAFFWWGLAAGATFFLFWPAMWVDPVSTVRSVLDTAFGYAAVLSETSDFFMGRVVEDAGLLFYPVALAFRSTPAVWLGLFAFLVLAIQAGLRVAACGVRALRTAVAERWFAYVALVAYAGLFLAAMSLATKKFDRYMLPVILALDVLAAAGLVQCVERWKRKAAWGLLIVVLLLQGGLVLSYHPHYLAYYNPLAGGSHMALRVMPLGWGEGMELAARYLNGKDGAKELAVATGGIPGLAPYFVGRVEPLTDGGLATSDYAVLYVSDIQQSSPLATQLSAQRPEMVIPVHGIDYLWIFPNMEGARLASFLRSQVGAQDTVVMDAWSPLHRDNPEATQVLDSGTEDEVAAQLGTVAAQHQVLWYVDYPESDPQGWISRQLATHALLWGREAFGQVTVSHYVLPSASSFASPDIRIDDASFGGKLWLIGYGLDEDVVEYRQELGVVLLWQSEEALAENYATSLRLRDGQGHTWAQEDQWLLDPVGAATSAWTAGETVRERYLLPILPGIPPGPYELVVTLYDKDTLQQVPVLDTTGPAAGTAHVVTQVQVAPPAIPSTLQELSIPHELRHDFGGQLELLGFAALPAEVRPGQTTEVGLFWTAQRAIESDCALLLALQDGTGRVWPQGQYALPNSDYPTSKWRIGEFVQTRSDLRVDAAVPSGLYSLFVNVVCMGVRDEGVPLGELNVRGRGHVFSAPETSFPAQAQIGEAIELVGYDLDAATVKPGAALRLTLYWHPQARVEKSYTVFTHLLDGQNRIWGQQDSVPCAGACETTSWLEGEFIADSYVIHVSPDAPAGEYRIGLGMYDPASMERLPAVEDNGTRWPDDRVMLATPIVVGEAGD